MIDMDTEYPPIEMSSEAKTALSRHMRIWSGWPDAVLMFRAPDVSPFAQTDHATHEFVADPARLVLNPNKVYLTVTPFRLRQEAVMTGALLHEAGHARHSNWQPRTVEQLPGGSEAMVHGSMWNEEPVSKQSMALAKLCEEPRIEGIISRTADVIGASNLGWTMRASAAHLLPTTTLTVNDDKQRLMDLITSWVLRAGRQLSIAENNPGYVMPDWVGDFSSLLHKQISEHLNGNSIWANVAKKLLTSMCCADETADTGTFMVDTAREVCSILFPETTGDEDDAPMPGDPMHSEEEGGSGEETETPDQGGSQEGEGDGESDDQGQGGSDTQSGAGKPGDGGSGSASGQGEGSDEDGEDGEGGATGSTDKPGADEDCLACGGIDDDCPVCGDLLAELLASIEAKADDGVEAEAEAKASEQPAVQPPAGGGGDGKGNGDTGGWRHPKPEEREVQRGAERFLRSLIAPTEASKQKISESPSSTIDGASFAQWKAGGQRSDPMFFRRTSREVTPAPPVKIAVLVDVSESMEVMQSPSAVLSWALSNAALDLRNFAGRGVQIESCMIHWGYAARVVQRNGAPLPGIREVKCNEGTRGMGEALGMIETEMPGFFSPSAKPEHRLLVHFTDWELWDRHDAAVTAYTKAALSAGVNMLSVVPDSFYTKRRIERAGSVILEGIIARCGAVRGRSTVLPYNKMFSDGAQVWAEAAKMLR